MYLYLDRPVCALAERDAFLLAAMRTWVAAARTGRCVCRALSSGFAARQAPDAMADFITAMAMLDRRGLEPVRVAPIVWPKVTDGEARLLSLFALGSGPHAGRAAAALVHDEAIAPLLGAIDAVRTILEETAA